MAAGLGIIGKVFEQKLWRSRAILSRGKTVRTLNGAFLTNKASGPLDPYPLPNEGRQR